MTAVFTFTADAGTDVITTSAPHGLVTGDGPIAVRNIGGALPGGLTALVDLFAIVTGASTIKLALSSANAMAGTAIDLTTNGTGTNILEIGIPYRRARTYVPRAVDVAGAQLKSADLNAIQDSLKALHALLTGQSQSLWSAFKLIVDNLDVNGDILGVGTLGIAGLATVGQLNVNGGLATLGGAVDFANQVRLASTISPSSIGSSTRIDDWAPTGLAGANVIRQAVSIGGGANVDVSGLTGGVAGRVLVLHALGATAADTITLLHENANSAAANRFSLASGANLVIPQFGAVTLQHDATSSRWRVTGKNF